MPFLKLTLAYDGAEFSGWQAQPGQRTVQGELERAWREITGESVRLAVAGRTDAGVHAWGQVASVESASRLSPEALVLALNAKLPEDVAVRAVEAAGEGFHATRHAKRKLYRYLIVNDPRRPVFLRRFAWHVPTPLDVAAMHNAAQRLLGRHDFASFQSAGSERESTVRTIYAASVSCGAGQGGAVGPLPPIERCAGGAETERDALIAIDVSGDGFLYNMVRAIAGTLVEVGRGRREPSWIDDVPAAARRSAAGQTAPAHGLALVQVDY
jgi:tRNA pseudouridine38-40 synthase